MTATLLTPEQVRERFLTKFGSGIRDSRYLGASRREEEESTLHDLV